LRYKHHIGYGKNIETETKKYFENIGDLKKKEYGEIEIRLRMDYKHFHSC
jgi:hypothetical protein